jgi:4a-hydroxytetrahydrobiopterin dehydratase
MAEMLTEKACTPCRGGVPPLSREEAGRYLDDVQGWELLDDGRRIERRFRFAGFRASLDFVEAVGELAEREQHHPEVCFGWGYAKVSLQTKKIKGLHENDFIMAAKINRLAASTAEPGPASAA